MASFRIDMIDVQIVSRCSKTMLIVKFWKPDATRRYPSPSVRPRPSSRFRRGSKVVAPAVIWRPSATSRAASLAERSIGRFGRVLALLSKTAQKCKSEREHCPRAGVLLSQMWVRGAGVRSGRSFISGAASERRAGAACVYDQAIRERG